MIKKELFAVLAKCSFIWPNFKLPTDDKTLKEFYKEWYEQLEPFAPDIIIAAIREYAKESDFCNLGKIVAKCEDIIAIINNINFNEDIIFQEINKAITRVPLVLQPGHQNFYYNSPKYGYEVNFDKLSKLAKRVVGTPSQLLSWGSCDVDSFQTVVASNIKRSIRNQIALEKQYRAITNNAQLSNIVKILNYNEKENQNDRL